MGGREEVCEGFVTRRQKFDASFYVGDAAGLEEFAEGDWVGGVYAALEDEVCEFGEGEGCVGFCPAVVGGSEVVSMGSNA